MEKLQRIQRKRTKGWRKPERCLCISRPSKWANPFRLIGDAIYVDAGYRRKVFSRWVLVDDSLNYSKKTIVDLYRYLWQSEPTSENPDYNHWVKHVQSLNLSELDQYDTICCWCRGDYICHGDVIIEMYEKYKANQMKQK
jgi:hypothetical protein